MERRRSRKKNKSKNVRAETGWLVRLWLQKARLLVMTLTVVVERSRK
jgi:hypothetical protein